MNPTTKLFKPAANAALIITMAGSAYGQTNVITLDENGHGFWNGTRLNYTVDADPFSHISTLHYYLPFSGSTNYPGDLILLEPADTNAFSDILRFDGRGSVWFFSQREEGRMPPYDLADVPQLPPMLSFLSVFFVTENGAEGQNGAVYIPNTPGQPGWDGSFQFTYLIISDVPEPDIFALMGIGAAALVIFSCASRRRLLLSHSSK